MEQTQTVQVACVNVENIGIDVFNQDGSWFISENIGDCYTNNRNKESKSRFYYVL